MKIDEAIKILDEVIPPPNNKMVDIPHLSIAVAFATIKEHVKSIAAEPVRHGKWIKESEN